MLIAQLQLYRQVKTVHYNYTNFTTNHFTSCSFSLAASSVQNSLPSVCLFVITHSVIF